MIKYPTMKIRICLILCLFACKALQAQDIDISGTWSMFEMTWSSGQDINTTTEDQLKDQGQMSEYFLMPDGTFKLSSNMTGSGKMENLEGTWKLDGDKLTFSFKMGENVRDITWDFDYKDDVFNLKRTFPDGSTSVVNCFKRKVSE